MNYSFSSKIILRTPLFSFQEFSRGEFGNSLRKTDFQEAVYFASRSFYDELKKKNFDFESCTERQKSTIIKYLNRSSFRSTPFGLFSSCAIADWTDNGDQAVYLSSSVKKYIRPDFSILQKLYETLMKSGHRNTMKFYPNSSIFNSELDVRYFKTSLGEKDDILFSVVSMKKNPVLKSVINFCEDGRTIVEMVIHLQNQYDLDTASLHSFVDDMIEEEILVSEYKPNVLGPSFVKKLFDVPNNSFGIIESAPFEKVFQAFTEEYRGELDSLIQIEEELKKKYSVSDNLKSIYYCVSERKSLHGGLSNDWQKKIMDGLSCLMHLTKPAYSEDLEKFKRAFLLRYEGKQMPVLEVLDPQLGIGYGGLDQINDSLGLLEYLNGEMTGSNGSAGRNAAEEAMEIILRDWFSSYTIDPVRELVITDEQIQKLSTTSKALNLPPSISVMFRIFGDKVVIEDAGNCTANSLISRFSCSTEIAGFCKELSAIEQKYNPEVVFAEISHICNLHTANINQRDYVREYEIPVLTQSSLSKNGQINLADLFVEVVNDTIVLWSNSLKKIVIPRLSTAFNFTKNQFPIFRFLCDLQSQHLQPNLYFDVQGLLPGLKFYPRIRYRDAILQLAEWHYNSSDFSEILSAPPDKQASLLEEFRKREHLPRYIAYCFHDNYLVYDLDSSSDKTQLIAEIKNKQKLLFREFPYLLNDNSMVRNEEGYPLLTQLVASLYKTEPAYQYHLLKQAKPTKQKSLADTRDWIYFKIYCHSLSTDAIIAESIIPSVKKAVNDGLIYEWFWLRYQDPEPHIRLRIMPSKNMYGTSFELINRLLNKLYQMKLVNRFHTDQYKRELERYSPELILQIEKIFCASSSLVASFLKQKLKYNWSDQRVLTEAVLSVRMILKALEYTKEGKLEFCTKYFEQFFTEFKKPKGLKPIVEKVNKLISDNVSILIQDSKGRQNYSVLEKNLSALVLQHRLRKVKSVTIESLAADIIHMHLNRIFTTNQRYFEMITYYLAKRNLQTELNKAAITR